MKLPKLIRLKNGTAAAVREPGLRDAEDLIRFVRQLDSETRYMLREPGELDLSPRREKEIIRMAREADNLKWIIAVQGGKIIGTAGLTLVGRKSRYRHRAEIGVAVIRDFWGQGVASALMQFLEQYASRIGVERVELTVGKTNERAVSLYEKRGYIRDGEIEHAVKYSDGTYEDEYRMHKDIKQEYYGSATMN